MKFNFTNNKKMENLYDYLFHYNIYTEEWNAFLRDDYNLYMGGLNQNVIVFRDKDMNKLIEKISQLQTEEIL